VSRGQIFSSATNTAQYTETAKRFVPEIFSFLLSVVHAFVVNNSTTQVPFQPLTFIAKTAVTVEPKQTQAKTPENNKNKKRKSDQKDDKPEQEEVVPPLDVSWLVRDSTPETAHGARLVKSVALSAAVHSLKTLCKITAESDYASGCVALLHTATKLLRAVPSLLPTPIMKMITATANLIAKSAAELEGKRNPLTLHETKPEPIKSLTPAFKEDEYVTIKVTRVKHELISLRSQIQPRQAQGQEQRAARAQTVAAQIQSRTQGR
jgi:hypothetical protein